MFNWGLRPLQSNVTLDDIYQNLFHLNDLYQKSTFVYQSINTLSAVTFGHNFYGLAFYNILFTYMAGIFFYKLIINMGFKNNATSLYIYFILYWEVVSWSTFASVKDTVILFLLVWIIYIVSKIILKQYTRYDFLFLFLVFYLVFHLRFYMVGVLLGSYGMFYIKQRFVNKSGIVNFMKIIILTIILLYIGMILFKLLFPIHYSFLLSYIGNPAFGAIKYLLTPKPWDVSPEYGWLELSALFHVLAFPFFIIGFIKYYKFNKIFFYISIFFLFTVLFYSLFSYQQGPKYRFQLSFIFVIYEYLGFTLILKKIYKSKRRIRYS